MAELTEYHHGTPFPGKIGRTTEESSPAWPAPVRTPDGAPNVLFFVLDDVGYGQLSSFGGLVETPNIDRVAATRACATRTCTRPRSARRRARACSPGATTIRAASPAIMELATGYPGYDGRMPFENGMLPEMLLEHGYNTFCVGKWHLSPSEENTAAGPFHRWPLGRGFERFYGFLGGETNQWYPDLTEDNRSIMQPKQPEEGYHLSEDLADQAIRMIRDAHVNAPEKPFFLYYATGAGHAPHHVAARVDREVRGEVRRGLGRLPRQGLRAAEGDRPVRAGRRAAAARPGRGRMGHAAGEERRLYARFMEVFAGFLSHADHHFGRMLDALEQLGELDNTLIMVISDNGASAEGGPVGSFNEMLFFNAVPRPSRTNMAKIDELGGPHAYNHYPWGWTWAGDTPFRRWKRETYRGGSTDPFVVGWPKAIAARGELRTSSLTRSTWRRPCSTRSGSSRREHPRRSAVAARGRQLRRHVRRAPTPPRSTRTQYFEMFGHRAIYHDGWRAVCPWPGPTFTEAAAKGRRSATRSRTRCSRSSTRTAGSSTTSRPTRPSRATWRPSIRERCAS